MEIITFKTIYIKVPRKILKKLFYSHRAIDKKTYNEIFKYKEALEEINNRSNHLISIIDRILSRY